MNIDALFGNKERITLGFFGGSITEGAGASENQFCYCQRVTQLLQQRYPETVFETVNASIGGTGSSLGAFRLKEDLLVHQPDFVFVEYAVNDFDTEKELCQRSMEGIVRQILNYRASCPIVFIYTLSDEMAKKYYDKGLIPQSIQYHQEVADYYHIPSINAGKPLYDTYTSQQLSVTEFLPDRVHPNDRGHEHYAQSILQVLPSMSFEIKYPKSPMRNNCLETGVMVPAKNYLASGWEYYPQSMFGRYPEYISSSQPGAKLTVPFHGSIIGIYHTIQKDSGMFSYSIDGKESTIFNSWDQYALQFDRACYFIPASDLDEDADHVLTIEVLEQKDEQSTGNMIRIGAFLMLE